MSTRKKILEELKYEIGQLTNVERDNIDALERQKETQRSNAERLEHAAKQYEESLVNASDKIASAAEDILAGLIISSVISSSSRINTKLDEQLIKRLTEIKRKTDMINSIIKLQEIHPFLTYRFIVERSYAANTNEEDRQTVLNKLITDGIVTQYRHNRKIKAWKIDENNSELIAYWDWLDELRVKLKKCL